MARATNRLAEELAVFCGNANPALARAISRHLRVPLSDMLVGRFSEGEIRVKINENVRGKEVPELIEGPEGRGGIRGASP